LIRKDYDDLIRLDDDNYLNYESWPYWDSNIVSNMVNGLESVILEIADNLMFYLVPCEVGFHYEKVTIKDLEANIDYYTGCNMSLTFMSNLIAYMLKPEGKALRNDLGEIAFDCRIPVYEKNDDVIRVIKKIFSAFEEPISIDGKTLNILLSVGVAKYPQDGEDIISLLKHADSALYEAKEKRTDHSYSFYDELA